MLVSTTTPRRLALAALCVGAVVFSQVGLAAGQGVRTKRLVHLFDFEEADDGNFESLPMHWYVTGRPAQSGDAQFNRQPLHRKLVNKVGFPRHGDVRFDHPQRNRKVNHRFYLGLNGDNVGAFLSVGAVPVVPGSDYLITARVATTAFKHARARIVGYFVTRTGERIDASVVSSPMVVTNGQTRDISLRLLGDHPAAAWLGLELEVLQPTRKPGSPLGKFQVTYRDVKGGAWFDDVAVWQVPRVAIRTQSPVNVVVAPQRPRLDITVRDLSGEALVAHLDLSDTSRRIIATQRRGVGVSSTDRWSWRPPIDRFGWYRVDLRVYRKGETDQPPLAHVVNAFLWRPRESSMSVSEARRFVIDAAGVPRDQVALMPELLEATQLTGLTVSAWQRDTELSDVVAYQAWLDRTLAPLYHRGGDVSLALSPLPRSLERAARLDYGGPLWLFSNAAAGGETTWTPYLSPVFMRNGQRVKNWRLGTPDRPVAFDLDDLPSRLASILDRFRSMTPRPQLTLPWRLDQPPPNGLKSPAWFVIDVPAGVQPTHLMDHLSSWQGHAENVSLRLTQPPADVVTQQRRVIGLTLAMLHGWASGVDGLSVTRPWAWTHDRQTLLLPDPLQGVFAQTAHRLAGRTYLGQFEPMRGVKAMVFDGPAGGMLAVWTTYADPNDTELNMYLGPSPTRIDVWGNRASVPQVDGKHRVKVGATPVFIDGIDARLALLRGSFVIEDSHIESTRVPHRRTIRLTNPWQRPLNGTLEVIGPTGWDFRLSRFEVAIAPGQTRELPVAVAFPVSEAAGQKTLVVRAKFETDKRYEVDLTAPMTLGLKDIDFDANLSVVTVKLEDGTERRDVLVTVLLANRGASMVNLHAFAAMPGFARQERLISALRPGQALVRTFRFQDGAASLKDNKVRVGVRDATGPAMLNQVLSANGP